MLSFKVIINIFWRRFKIIIRYAGKMSSVFQNNKKVLKTGLGYEITNYATFANFAKKKSINPSLGPIYYKFGFMIKVLKIFYVS